MTDLIIALDVPSAAEARAVVDTLGDAVSFYKVGLELFIADGEATLAMLRERGKRVFLDLKLHDIPNTVKSAMAVLSRLDADIVNLHAAGGSAMMKAALEGLARPDGTRPLLIAVTQLTSTDSATLRDELLIGTPMAETVLRYAENAARSGLDGVVCSPLEAAAVKARCGAGFLTVTPGVRFAGGDVGDQKRVMTPAAAAGAGCDLLVMGRPITRADDPVAAYRRACGEFGLTL